MLNACTKKSGNLLKAPYTFKKIYLNNTIHRSLHDAKVLDFGPEVTDFKLQLYYYNHFWIDTLGNGMNPLISPTMG